MTNISTTSTPNLAQMILDRENCKPLKDAFNEFQKLVKELPDAETRTNFMSAALELVYTAEENAFDKAAAYQMAIMADEQQAQEDF